jgi:hypothetical protein
MTRRSASPWLAAVIAVGVLVAAPARADPPPLRVDYQAAEGCPDEEVFVGEIRRRTPLARLAAPGEEGFRVHAEIVRRDEVSDGRLVLGAGEARVTREIRSERCEEVVSAFALIAALAIDPRAISAPLPPAPPPAAPPVPPSPLPPPRAPARAPPPPPVSPWTGPAQILAEPLPAPPSIAPPPAPPLRAWTIGARGAVAFAVTPRALIGGGVFLDRAFEGRFAPSLRLAVEIAGTGSFDAGPAGASFLRGVARLEGCAFAARPLPRISIVPCLGVEGGVLHGQGIASASLPRVQAAGVPWFGAGVLPRASLDLGALAIEAQGGPMFPLVRRTFAFDGPAYVISTLPPVTWAALLGVGFHFW